MTLGAGLFRELAIQYGEGHARKILAGEDAGKIAVTLAAEHGVARVVESGVVKWTIWMPKDDLSDEPIEE